MYHRRICRTAVTALAVAAMAAPAASAMPVDENTPPSRGLYEPMTPVEPRQDLRHADTKDYAEGRGTYNAPEVVVLESPAPKAAATGGGIHWEDVGIGAGALLGIVVIGAGGALVVTRRSSGQFAS